MAVKTLLRKNNNSSNVLKDNVKAYESYRSIMKVTSLDESLHHSNLSKSTCRLSNCNSSYMSDVDRSVSFHKVEIREYNMTIGDNPSSRMGPPVGISWKHRNEVSMSLNDYEDVRGERRTLKEMFLPRERKYDIIKESGVPNKQIASTIRQVNRIKNQRIQTANNATKFQKFEEGFESAIRKIKRFFLRRKRDSKWWAQWKKDNEDLLDLSVHNGRINRIIESNHTLERISSDAEEEMSEISTISSNGGCRGVSTTAKAMKPIIISEEEDDDLFPTLDPTHKALTAIAT